MRPVVSLKSKFRNKIPKYSALSQQNATQTGYDSLTHSNIGTKNTLAPSFFSPPPPTALVTHTVLIPCCTLSHEEMHSAMSFCPHLTVTLSLTLALCNTLVSFECRACSMCEPVWMFKTCSTVWSVLVQNRVSLYNIISSSHLLCFDWSTLAVRNGRGYFWEFYCLVWRYGSTFGHFDLI